MSIRNLNRVNGMVDQNRVGKGIRCYCPNMSCRVYQRISYRKRKEFGLGNCYSCGTELKQSLDTRTSKRLEKARKEYEAIQGNCNLADVGYRRSITR